MMLSPRELAPENLPDRRWLNEHLTYTHGFGLTMGPVNQVTADGLPVLLVKDIPPVSSVDSIQVRRPEIYFGKRSTNMRLWHQQSRVQLPLRRRKRLFHL